MKLSNLIWVIVCIAIPFAYAFYLFPSLPETIPTHFNLEGKADAWGNKSSVFLPAAILGLTSLFCYFLLINLKSIDPKRVAKADEGLYTKMALYLVAFLSALSLVIIYSTAHEGVKISQLLFPLLGLFLAGFGAYMRNIKQNYFAGFRLPWTLENEENWNATHKLAGKVWMIGGSLQFLSGLIFEGQLTFGIFMTLVLLMVLIPSAYSYILFRNRF